MALSIGRVKGGGEILKIFFFGISWLGLGGCFWGLPYFQGLFAWSRRCLLRVAFAGQREQKVGTHRPADLQAQCQFFAKSRRHGKRTPIFGRHGNHKLTYPPSPFDLVSEVLLPLPFAGSGLGASCRGCEMF